MLAGLMRPDADEATARAHLRRNLHRARALLPADDALHADDNRLRWIGECDVVEFLAAVDARDWKRAIELHGAPLLAGTGAFGDAAIDDWVAAERERLLGRLRVALVARLAEPSCDDAERALGITRLIDLDPMDETALQSALEAANGPASRAAALAACDLVLGHLKKRHGYRADAAHAGIARAHARFGGRGRRPRGRIDSAQVRNVARGRAVPLRGWMTRRRWSAATPRCARWCRG